MSLFLALLAAATPAQPAMMLPICADARPKPVQADSRAGPRKLGDLPPAEAYLTVMRTENGCIRPVKVSEERARRR